MKKMLAALLCLLMIASLSGCGAKDADTPNATVPSIVYNGEVYCTTGKQVPAEVDESAIVGKVTAVVPLSEWPSEEGQANFGEIGAPYAITSDGLVVEVNNEWTIFELRTDN
ncbi:MAG: hypothetical protein Q4C13_07585 [Clostridia bacterium]|nr:hypothetical protein [Clostridia bacterium]